MYSIRMAVPTGMRWMAAKYTSWHPATPMSAMPSTLHLPRHSADQLPRSE